MNDILYSLALEFNGSWMRVYAALQQKYMPTKIKNMPKNYVSIIDEKYPDFMKDYYKPSFILIKKGNKWYVPYGKGLKKSFEVKPNAEEKYLENLKKFC